MYIPSIYASLQTINCISGNNAITATNVNYTRLTVPSTMSCNGTGFAGPFYMIEQNTASNIYVYVLSPSNISGCAAANHVRVHVEEFVPFFFRRPFYHSAVVINTQKLSDTTATGIVFGPKAFIVSRGWNYNIGSGGALEITDAQIWSELTLDIATGVVTASRRQKDYLNNPGDPEHPSQGIVHHMFTIIDPW